MPGWRRGHAGRVRPTAIPAEIEAEIVLLRKQLAEEGPDAGAATIHWHLVRGGGPAPSVSTIWRVLKRGGFVAPQPKKRPRSSFIRFEAALPNETWQSDMTHWALADGTDVEIVNFIDDHSRLCVASVALAVARATAVVEIFEIARQRHGTPASVLTDNGAIYTARYRNGRVAFEIALEALGVIHKHSSPYHPQTCGKVERFHQTLKRFLAKQAPAADLVELQGQLDRFVAYYNEARPHRGIGRRTPREVFDAKVKARPAARVADTHFRVRHDKVDTTGCVTLRHESRLLHIGLGRAHKGEPVLLLVAGRDVRVLSEDGELIRQVTIDPTRDYQPIR